MPFPRCRWVAAIERHYIFAGHHVVEGNFAFFGGSETETFQIIRFFYWICLWLGRLVFELACRCFNFGVTIASLTLCVPQRRRTSLWELITSHVGMNVTQEVFVLGVLYRVG